MILNFMALKRHLRNAGRYIDTIRSVDPEFQKHLWISCVCGAAIGVFLGVFWNMVF